jgi:hypothetical protein
MTDTKKNARELLLALGVGHFNATQVIPYLLIAPATTDPKAPQIALLVRHLQQVLFNMGATDVANTGALDLPTARALRLIAGPNWERMTWGSNLQAVLAAAGRGQRLTPAPSSVPDAISPSTLTPTPVAVSGPLDFLPDVPGGLLTYGVAAYLIYRHFRRRSGDHSRSSR